MTLSLGSQATPLGPHLPRPPPSTAEGTFPPPFVLPALHARARLPRAVPRPSLAGSRPLGGDGPGLVLLWLPPLLGLVDGGCVASALAFSWDDLDGHPLPSLFGGLFCALLGCLGFSWPTVTVPPPFVGFVFCPFFSINLGEDFMVA